MLLLQDTEPLYLCQFNKRNKMVSQVRIGALRNDLQKDTVTLASQVSLPRWVVENWTPIEHTTVLSPAWPA